MNANNVKIPVDEETRCLPVLQNQPYDGALFLAPAGHVPVTPARNHGDKRCHKKGCTERHFVR